MKKMRKTLRLPLIALAILSVSNASEDKMIFGHDEIVILPQFKNLQIHAKLDTGAKTASLSAQELKLFTKNKETWVRFQLEDKKKNYEFPVKRMARIKKRVGEMEEEDDETSVKRPVILLDVCLGKHRKEIEVNLTDRSRFEYGLLIGKDGLTELNAIVDPSISEVSTPECPTVK